MTTPSSTPSSPPNRRANIADILCIGAQRAMTSWLHHVLSAHPRLWAFPDFSPVTSTAKEAHFWDWNRHRGVEWYRVLMTPPDDPTRRSLDFTPDYALLGDEQIAECKALNPEARVIYLLRDPLARALSTLRMHLFWRGHDETAPPLTLDEGFHTLIEQSALHAHGAYCDNARRWRRHYPDMLVLNIEDLQARPEAMLAQVLAHCLPGEHAEASADLPPEMRARLGKTLWQTPRYRFDDDCLHFTAGATWLEREASRKEFGFQFNEFSALLSKGENPGASERPRND